MPDEIAALPFPDPVSRVARIAWTDDGIIPGTRSLAQETPVALTYNGTTQAVMMASPRDIADFALGFSLTEGIIADAADLLSLDVIAVEDGIEARMWIADDKMRLLSARRRHLAGPTGCGLCGMESLSEAVRPSAQVSSAARLTSDQVREAMARLAPMQVLNIETRAVHAAGYYEPERGLVAVREDVGRHNALDKLVGHVRGGGLAPPADPAGGVLLLTSRVSIEMVQKAAVLGVGIVAAVSAPTALAVRTAHRAGMTLAAIVRGDGFEVFTHPARIIAGPGQDHTDVD